MLESTVLLSCVRLYYNKFQLIVNLSGASLSPFSVAVNSCWGGGAAHSLKDCLICLKEHEQNSCFSLPSLHSISFFLRFPQGLCVFQSISAQSGETLPDNFIGFDSVPDEVADGSVVRVRFQCSGPCQLTVEVVVSTLRKTDLVVFRRKWISSAPQVHRIQPVRLRLPPSISDHHDFLNGNILDNQNVTVCAWLDYLSTSSEIATQHSSVLKVYKVLQVMPLFEWPSKPLAGCPSLSAQLAWLMTSNRIPQCPHESGQSFSSNTTSSSQ